MEDFKIFFEHYCRNLGFSADLSQDQLALDFAKWNLSNPRGWYIWGDVGRGKSTVTKAFYEFYPSKRKRWIHFADWMLELQQQLALYSSQDAFLKKRLFFFRPPLPVEKVIKEMLRPIDMLFLDEFSLHHIAEVSILQKVLPLLLNKGLKIITTSNFHPNDLYKNGLNRDGLNHFFLFLKTQLKVVNIGGSEDFRQQKRQENYNYFLNMQKIETTLSRLAPLEKFTPFSLLHQQRYFNYIKTYKDIAWCTFEELCTKNRSLQDYQLLFSFIKKLFIVDLPLLDQTNKDSVKRFIILVDFLYENEIQLFLQGLNPFEEIFSLIEEDFPWKRTHSRLIEMLSRNTVQG